MPELNAEAASIEVRNTLRYEIADEDEFDADKDVDPIAALIQLKIDYKANERGHNENQWCLIGRATTTCARLRETEEEINKFYRHPFWPESKHKKNPKKLQLHVMQFMLNAPTSESPGYNTASDYAQAVQLLRDEGYQPCNIFAELKLRKGPYSILEASRETGGSRKRGAGEAEAGEDPETASKAYPPAAQLEAPDGSSTQGLQETAPDTTATSVANQNTRPSKGARMFSAKKHIALTGNEYLDPILGMTLYERRWALIERVANEGKNLRFEVVKMRPEQGGE